MTCNISLSFPTLENLSLYPITPSRHLLMCMTWPTFVFISYLCFCVTEYDFIVTVNSYPVLLPMTSFFCSADLPMSFEDRVAAVGISTQFQERSEDVFKMVVEETDFAKTQVCI